MIVLLCGCDEYPCTAASRGCARGRAAYAGEWRGSVGGGDADDVSAKSGATLIP